MFEPTPSTNRTALASLLAALLTVFSFCIGVAPIPMTAVVCYPTAVLTGLAAIVTGTRALRQVRSSGEKGRGFALAGIWVGGLTLLAVACATTLTLLLFFYGAETLQTLLPALKP